MSGGGFLRANWDEGSQGKTIHSESRHDEKTALASASPSRPSQEERNWASLTHATILLAPWTGIGGAIASLLIWATKRGESPYIGWQSLQAWIYQFMGSALFAALGLLAVFPPEGIIRAYRRELIVCAIALLLPAFLGYGCYGAYACSKGRDFKYLVIGSVLSPRK